MEQIVKFVQSLNRSKRWDYHFHQQKFIDLERNLEKSPYPIYSVKQITEQVIDGTHFTPQYTDDSGVLFLMARNVRPFEINLDNVTYITQQEHQKLIRCKPEPGDVLITKDGTIGVAAVVPDYLPEFNIFVSVIKVRPCSIVSPHYLAAFFNSELGKLQIAQQIKGASITHIHLEDIRRLKIPLPPRPIQDQIAKVMQDAYAKRRGKLEEIQGLLTDIDKLVLSQIGLSYVMFPDKKQFVINSRKILGGRFDLGLYNTQYTGIVSELKSKFTENLKPIASISYPVTSGATPLGSTYLREGVPFLRVQNVNAEGVVDFNGCLFVSEEFARTINRSALQDGDVLLVIVGATIGKCAVVKGINSSTVINQALARIRIRESAAIIPDFLQAFLSSQAGQIQITALKRPVAQGNLSLTEIGQILVPVISLEVQQEIAQEMERRRFYAKYIRAEAETLITVAKARVERMILGEEEVA